MGMVKGYCPMGCGPTLIVTPAESIRCGWIDCSRPTAAAEILADRETEHIVWLTLADFTIKHPLRERLENALAECPLHRWLESREKPPQPPGVWRVFIRRPLWAWEEASNERTDADTRRETSG